MCRLKLLPSFLFLLACFVFTPFLHAQTSNVNDFYNSDAFWKHVQLDKSDYVPALMDADTTIVVVSTRKMLPGQLRFMSEKKDDSGKRYFFVYTCKGVWHVLQANSLKQAMDHMPDKYRDWVVYTEGMGKIFTSDIDRGIRMAGVYQVNVVLLDYPSISTTYRAFHNYRFALHNARIAYKDFMPVFDSLKLYRSEGYFGKKNLSLFFHSMGNNLAYELIKNNRLPELNNTVWIDNLILNAACVKQRHHKRWVDAIHFAKQIYINYNPNDKTLYLAHLASFKKQLGEKVKLPISKNAQYINFSTIAGENHSNFLPLLGHQPVAGILINQYSVMLHGLPIPIYDRDVYEPTNYKGIGIDILPQ